MRKYIITTDTTCDLPIEYLDQKGIKALPLYYNFDGTIYGDENTLEPKDFFEKMRGGAMPTTMAVNPDAANTLFRSLIQEGYDVLHIAFSSALSGSCSVAATVAREICDENPDANIIVIDSLAASLGEGLLVHKACELKDSGKTINQVAEWLEANKLTINHIFTVNDLHHLHRGGRVSKTSAIIGTLINVKPVLHINNDGKLVPLYNVRGRKKALLSLVEEMEKLTNQGSIMNDTVFISHGDCLDEAQVVADHIKERFAVENILINHICPTIGAHAGPGTIALFFLGQGR